MKKIFFLIAVCCMVVSATADVVRVKSFKQNNLKYQHDAVKEREVVNTPKVQGEGFSPFAISFVPGVALPGENWDVLLFRINIFAGRHNNVYGLDVGTIFNEAKNNLVGIQCAGFCNKVGFSEGAFQIAGIYNRSNGDYVGLQLASALNFTEGTLNGIQVGLVNKTEKIEGLQIGFCNYTHIGEGVQLGVLNFAEDFKGIQIGFSNYNKNSSIMFCPFVNFAF